MPFDPAFRRSNPSRFRTAWRVRGLVLMLGLVLIAIQYASKPEHWRWLTDNPQARQRAIADRTAPGGLTTGAPAGVDDEPLTGDVIRAVPAETTAKKSETSSDSATPQSPSDVRLPRELFDNVSESHIGIRRDEREAYFAVLAKARDTRLPMLERAARRDLGYFELFNDPESYRGEVVALEGQLRRLIAIPAGDNSHGFETLYEGWLFTEESGTNPYRLVFSRLPEGIPTGERVRLSAKFVGYFFKRTGYQNKTGDLQSAPLLLGKTLRWEPETTLDTGVSTNTMFIVIGLVAGLCVVLTVLMRHVTTSDQRFQHRHRQLADLPRDTAVELPNLDVIDPREELRRLSELSQKESAAQADTNPASEPVAKESP